MRELTGTWVLVRFTARRDRVRIRVWVACIVALVVLTAASVEALFPTQAALDRAAAVSTDAAVIAFNGPAQGLDTPGGEVAFQAGTIGLILVALMNLFTIVLLGNAFVARAVGDIRGGRLSWLSPIGWSQKLRPYAGERWWPLLPASAPPASSSGARLRPSG